MLTKDLLRHRLHEGRIQPHLLKSTPAIVALAQQLLDFWDAGVGRCLGELEDAALPILHGTRSLLVAKGLQKLVRDACTFRDAASCFDLRELALKESARRLQQDPPADPAKHRAAVSAAIGQPLDLLYGDLPDAAVLESGSGLTVAKLLARYNLAQCQGLLLTARELDVTIHDADTGMRRRLLMALRFQRLLVEVRADGPRLRLGIAGPGAVLDQASRYGLNLALFLPALACATHWEATAWVAPDRERTPLRLDLSDATGLIGDNRFLGHVPEEIRIFRAELTEKRRDWQQQEPALLTTRSGEVVVPDLQFSVGDETIAVECFHRWHHAALTRRLDQLAAGELPQLIIGVDRAAAKRLPDLTRHPGYLRRGFLFTDLPTVRALSGVINNG